MRNGGIFKRCYEATELKPVCTSLSFFLIFGLNVALSILTFNASFLEALVKKFGLKVLILRGLLPFAATLELCVLTKNFVPVTSKSGHFDEI